MSKSRGERILIGIDPGTIVMGYGLLSVRGQHAEMLTMGVIELSRYEDHYTRLGRIYSRVAGLIDEFLPDETALEAPFYGKNVQSKMCIRDRCSAQPFPCSRRGWSQQHRAGSHLSSPSSGSN